MNKTLDEWGSQWQEWRPAWSTPASHPSEIRKTVKEVGKALLEGESTVWHITQVIDEIEDLLIEKNAAYGDSFSNPINVFSKATAKEQIFVRIDDKLNRLQKGSEYQGDDTVLDLIGYLILLRVLDRRDRNA